MLPTLFLFTLLIVQPGSAKTTVKALRSFETGDAVCVLKVIDRALPVPDEKITISCNHLTILTDDLGQADLLDVEIDGQSPFYSDDQNDPDSVRAIVTYGSGLTATLVVYEISKTPDKPTAKVIYGHGSKTAPEAFEGGYVILEHVKRRFVGARILPGGTNLYRWQEGHYRFVEGFRWSESASWVDRYCILYKPESCPAERTKTRILDEYEH